MKVNIRQAKIEDFENILPLFKQLQPQKEINTGKLKDFYGELIGSDKHFVWVAEIDEKIIGYIDIVFRTYHFAFEFVGRIETTIVDKNYRRLGIATKLIKECEKYAESLGCKVIELDSTTTREEAHKFYESNGYNKRGFLFWKHL